MKKSIWGSVLGLLGGGRPSEEPKSAPEGQVLYQLEIQEPREGEFRLHMLQVVAPLRHEEWDGALTVTAGWFFPLAGKTRDEARQSARSIIDSAQGSGDVLYWKPGTLEETHYGRQ